GLAGCLLFSLVVSARAQRLQDGSRKFDEVSREPSKKARKLFKSPSTFSKDNKAHKTAVEFASKEIVYPLHWEADNKKLGKLFTYYDELDTTLAQTTRDIKGSADLVGAFTREVIKHCGEVIDQGKPISALNAARFLARLPLRTLKRGSLQD